MSQTHLETSSGILGSIGEINDIQQEIESYTKKIEHEKINLRLVKERHQKQLNTYNELQNKRKPKIVWERPKANTYQAKKIFIEGHDKKEFAFTRDIGLNETELECISDEVNQLILDNKELRRHIEELRKEKKSCSTQLEILKGSKKSLEVELKVLIEENKFNESDNNGMISIKKSEFARTKNSGDEEQKRFENERQVLEGRYHTLLEDNIRREREEKKEISKKRFKLADIRPKKKNEIEISAMEEEDISDRTPILDQLIDKWRYIIKYKKNMIERYRKNIYITEMSFEKICNVLKLYYLKILGITDYREIPFILEKIEDQNSSIKLLINQLFNEVLVLQQEKKSSESQINLLKNTNSKTSMEKVSFNEHTTSQISKLKEQIVQLNADIERKRDFFLKLQDPTDDFLESLSTSYISDFVTGKVGINRAVKYNETNINDIIANVQDYQKLLEDSERVLLTNERRIETENNRSIERLQQDNKIKLDMINKKDVMSREMNNIIKNDARNNLGFDETIKRMAEEVMKMVNSQKKDETKKKK